LSTEELSHIEKLLLARTYRIGAWLGEAVTNLVTCSPMPKFEDLAILGLDVVARILWIRENFPPNKLYFRRDAIKCGNCSTSSSLKIPNLTVNNCGHVASGDAELTVSGSATPISGTIDRMVKLNQIECSICSHPFVKMSPLSSINYCDFCGSLTSYLNVRVTPHTGKPFMRIIEEMFGEELRDYKFTC
jgi:hypothetical protein